MRRVVGAAVGVLLLLAALVVGWRERGRPPAARAPSEGPAPAGGHDRLSHAPQPLPVIRLSGAEVGGEAGQGGELAGRVVSTTSGAGVAAATLGFFHEGAAHTVTTDGAGRFVFRAPTPGRYELVEAIADGYLPFEPELGASPIALEARAGVRISDVTLYLQPAVEYLGVVLDGAGRPVEGAEVRRLDAVGPRFTADARGEVRFRAPDFALLEARHPAHGRARAVLDLPAQASRRVTFKLAPADGAPAGKIAGRVVDGRGHPLDGALVTAACRDGALHPEPRTTTSADGRFTLEGLDDCPHLVTARSRSLQPASARGVAPGTRDLELALAAGGLLRGRVRDGAGRPPAAFTVLLTERRGSVERGEATSASFFDAEGRFEIAGLAPGSYAVSAAANGRAPAAERTVEIPAPPGVAEVELELERGGRVRGVVVDRASRQVLAGARVSLEGALDAETTFAPISSSTTTDGSGMFLLGGLRPGLHSLQVAADGHNPRLYSGLRLDPDGELGPLTIDLAATLPGEEPKMEYVGIGVVIRAEGDAMILVNAVPGGGAAQAGLVPGDAILAIDGVPAGDLGFAGSIERIRGPEGTTVILRVRRKADGQSADVAVVRRALNR